MRAHTVYAFRNRESANTVILFADNYRTRKYNRITNASYHRLARTCKRYTVVIDNYDIGWTCYCKR